MHNKQLLLTALGMSEAARALCARAAFVVRRRSRIAVVGQTNHVGA
jgi:hypothetical protein